MTKETTTLDADDFERHAVWLRRLARSLVADGGFALPLDSVEGVDYAVVADKAGYATAFVTGRLDREHSIALRPAMTVHGRILEFETLEPIADALLVLGPELFGGDAGMFQWSDGVLTTIRTRSDGAYRIHGLPSGAEIPVTVRRAGHVPHSRRIVLGDEAEVEFDILVPGGAAVYGRVFDVETGIPLEGVTVHTSEAAMAAVTNGAGEFSVASLRGEEPWVSVSPQGYAWTIRKRQREEFPQDEFLPLPVIRSTTIIGTVLDAAGGPVSGATVSADVIGADPALLHELYPAFAAPDISVREALAGNEAVTDAEGRFRLTGIPPLGAVALRARIGGAGDHLVLRHGVYLDRAGAKVEVTLQAGSGGSIAGKATLEGAPYKIAVIWSAAGGEGTVWTETGEYRIDDVPPGPVELSVYVNSGLREQRTVVVSAGEVAEADFDIPDHKSIIAGFVRTPEGEPRAGVSIKPFPPGTWGTYSNKDGSFRYEVPVAAGTAVRLELEEFPFTLDGGEAITGREDIVVEFPAVVERALRIVDADTDVALPRVRVRFHSRTDPPVVPFEVWEVVKPGPGGVSRLKLPALRLDLEFQAAGYEGLLVEDVVISSELGVEPLPVRMSRIP